MAKEIAESALELPTNWVVARYSLSRLGLFPVFRAEYAEVVRVRDGDGVPLATAFDTDAYRNTGAGRTWSIELHSSKPDAQAFMAAMLQAVSMEIITTHCDPDSAIGHACEAMEEARASGELAFASVDGDPPPVAVQAV